MQWQLFSGEVPYVSTFDYHKDRSRAPHIDQPGHRPRLERAGQMVQRSYQDFMEDKDPFLQDFRVVDLGCGDGGFIRHLLDMRFGEIDVYGFDFTPDMKNGWVERGVKERCRRLNVFPERPAPEPIHYKVLDIVKVSNVVVMTEVLEHLGRPHEALKKICEAKDTIDIVVSSPWNEDDKSHDLSHAWAWDREGYEELIEGAGFAIIDYARAGFSQVVRARTRR